MFWWDPCAWRAVTVNCVHHSVFIQLRHYLVRKASELANRRDNTIDIVAFSAL